MMKSLIFSSQNRNSYIYDYDKHFFSLCHPELKKVFNSQDETGNNYYSKKYKYLKKHGFFKDSELADFDVYIDEYTIKEGIIQSQQIVFETTDFCNMKCTYCSLGDLYTFSKTEKKNIDTNCALILLRYILDLKPENTPLAISFFGGEPLMNFTFIKTIVEEVKNLNKKKYFQLTFNMTTNATLVHKYIDFLVENDIHLLISLDGDEYAQSYRKLKNGTSSFQKVIMNIDMIMEKYPTYFENSVGFNSVLHNRNNVQEIYEFIYNRYQKFPIISPLNNSYVNYENKEVLENMFHSKRKSEYAFLESESNLKSITHERLGLYEVMYKFLRNYSINSYYSNILSLLYDQVKTVPTGTCPPFRRKLFLNTKNQLLPCEKVNYNYFLGTVDNNVNIDFHRIAEKYNSYYRKVKTICNHCYLSKACPICLLSLEHLDDFGASEFICPLYTDEESFSNKLDDVFTFLEKFPSDCMNVVENSIID